MSHHPREGEGCYCMHGCPQVFQKHSFFLNMSSDDNSDNSSSNDSSQDTSSEAAGVVRGLARSIQGVMRHPGVGSLPRRPVLKELKNMIRFPGVGSLPRQTTVLKRRLPVQRVASVSDRLSTGMDLFQTAVEQQIEEASRLKRVTTFVKSLVKNTLLGAAVFETYEYMVTYLAPPEQSCQQMNNKNDHNNDLVDDDVYARASLQSHFLAGACGGFVHAIPSTFWEQQQQSSNVVMMSSSRALSQCYYLSAMIIHHSIAHSILFGCYESIKRELVLRDKQQQPQFRHDEIPYFASVSTAGGLAGQIQHVISHYTEQWLLLVGAENTTAAPSSSRLVIQLLPRVFVSASPPTLRPTLFAFFPSAISFVAFEYGKRILT